MKRIFVAIPLSRSLQNEIKLWQNSHRNLNVRWQAGKDLHMTLVPPWHVNEADSTIDALRNIRFHPFSLSFQEVSFGPNSQEPRLIWATGQAPRENLDLRMKILECLGQRVGGNFKMHVTVARFHPEDYRSFPVKTMQESVRWHEHASSFVLMETHRTPEGSDYEILETFNAS